MACPHFEVSINTGPKSSAVATAAYNSASVLFCERQQVNKNYKYKSDEIFFSEVLLPTNAPAEFNDREVLWNSVEMNEKQSNAQYCRVIKAAIPREVKQDEYINYIREFCNETFVSKGMCCDYAIHDKGDGNPHVHILLTMRALDEDGNWLAKCKKEYILDKDGNKTYYANGEAKSRKVYTTDWDNKGNVEKWRHSWEVISNKYLELSGSDDRLDLRSYERQGINKLPTEHLGPAASALEKKGVETDVGNINRAISAFNEAIEKIAELFEAFVKTLASLKRKPKPYIDPLLPELFFKYVELNEPKRRYLPYNKRIVAETQDICDISNALSYLKSIKVLTLDDLTEFINKVETDNEKIFKEIDKHKAKQKELKHIVGSRKLVEKHKDVYNIYNSKIFKKQFYQEHKKEIDSYIKNQKYLSHHETEETKAQGLMMLSATIDATDSIINELQQKLKVRGKYSFVKLKEIYDTVIKDYTPVPVSSLNDKDYIEESRSSISDKLSKAKLRVNEESIPKGIKNEKSINKEL